MSKQIASIPLTSIERIAIVFGNGRSLAQTKGDADYIINGGFYDMTTGKPVCHLKANGTVYAKENWSCYGMVWDKGGDIRMDVVPDKGGSNYISCVELLTPGRGPTSALTYNAEVGGVRGRSAIALTGDKLLLYCSGDGTADAKTPEALRDELVSLGAQSAIMLDSGGSSQCDFRGQTISSSRRVHNYIAVYLKKETGTEPEKEENKMSKKVVLDPGHGVETAGKRSPDGTYFEHEFALDMAQRLKTILERHGVETILTREDEHDVLLAKRVEISNAAAPDLFVSLHSNAAGSGSQWMSARGYGIYTCAAGDTAGRNIAAKAILARAQEAGIHLWGSGLFHNTFYVLKYTVAPAVLIEHLFHDNLEDTALLKDTAYRDKLAQVDAKGILDYLGIAWQDEPTTGGGEAKEGEKASDWAAESWEKAKALGIFDGTDPQGAMTREMTATVLDRLGLLK